MESIVKVGDTIPDIQEGLNAGIWSIELAKTGNEMGMTEAEIDALDPVVRSEKLERARKRMHQTGAHYVVDSVGDVPPLIDQRLAAGERP